MKKTNIFSLAFTYAGCFLGAGFVSGQELWQFFGTFGALGYAGLSIALLTIFIFGTILLTTIRKSKIEEMDKIVIFWNSPLLRALVGAFETFFMFGVVVVMVAGAGALIDQLFNIPAIIGSTVFCVLLFFIAVCGMNGVIVAFSLTVPFLVLITLIVCGTTIIQNDITVTTQVTSQTSLVAGNWFLSMLTFISYNLFGAIGIIAPFAKIAGSPKKRAVGIALGSLFLTIIAFFIVTTLMAVPEAPLSELPILTVAFRLNSIYGYISAALLLSGMFGTSLSRIVAIVNYTNQKIEQTKKYRVLLIGVFCTIAVAGSSFGFGNLISVVFPLSGYLGITILVCIIIHYLKLISVKEN